MSTALAVSVASFSFTGALVASANPAPSPSPFVKNTPTPTAAGAGDFSGTVPAGVCAVRAEAVGGAGGSSIANSSAATTPTNGAGADVTATFRVVPGQTYDGVVGTGGTFGSTNVAPPGGTPGGGAGGLTAATTKHNGAGGGGYTNLTLGGLEVLVAGGGGGSGGGHSTTDGRGGDAGLPTAPGVTAGSDGTGGVDNPSTAVVTGGRGGGTSGPGAGGTNSADSGRDGADGSGRSGGHGGDDPTPDAGGGAGGGFYGGGGGAATLGNGSGAPAPGGVGGGGGGGGSSFVRATSPDGSGEAPTGISSKRGPVLGQGGTVDGSAGSMTLTWITCDYDLVVTKTVSPSPAVVGQTATWTVSVTNQGPDPMTQGDTLTLSDDLPGSGAKTITALDVSGGSNDRGLARGELTCDAEVGDPMPASLACSRAYEASAPTAPTTGVRGLDPGETLTVVYTQTVSGADVGTLDNTASVTDRGASDDNAATRSLTVTRPQPTSGPDTSTGTQGAPQSVNPVANDAAGSSTAPLDPSTLTLLNAAGAAVTSLTVPGEGTYTVDRTDPDAPLLVFTPLAGFSGPATPASYRVEDSLGSTTTNTYTPTVTQVARPDTATGAQGVPLTQDVLANDAAPGVTLDPGTLTLIGADGQPATSVSVAGGDYSLVDGKVVFTPAAGFTGTAPPVTYQVSDSAGNAIRSTFTPTITPVTPAASPDSSSGPQGAPQQVAPLANDSAGDPGLTLDPASLTLLDPDGTLAAGDVTVAGQGTYRIDRADPAAPLIVFTPVPDFSGTPDPVDYRVANSNGTTTRSTYGPRVTDVTQPDTSADIQGAAQTTNVLANDNLSVPAGGALDPTSLQLIDPADGAAKDTVTLAGVGTYASDDSGNVVFTPLRTFTGTAPAISYAVLDQQGNRLVDTYVPTVTPVAPVANPDTTSGPQGVPQRINPVTDDVPGDPRVLLDPASLTLLDGGGDPVDTLVVDGQGTYTVDRSDPDVPVLIFTPLRTYVGPVTPATYRVADVNGTQARSTYTPTFDAVAPVANPDTTSGPQGALQRVDPTANDRPGDTSVPLDRKSLTLLTSGGAATDTLVVPGQGTYEVDRADPANPTLTFRPLPGFDGQVTPVDYAIFDVNGTKARSTYTPTVTPVTRPDTSSDVQGVAQSVNVLANNTVSTPGGGGLDPSTLQLIDPADGVAKDSVTVPGVGTYAADTTGGVTFQPLPTYAGTPAALTYTVRDLSGGTLTDTYTPTVTALAPTANPDTTSGPQGVPQRINPVTDDVPGDPRVLLDPASLTLLDGGGDPVDTLVVEGQGTYTVDRSDPDVPELVFTPLPTYVGPVTPATYRVADVNGTQARSTYTPALDAVAPVANPDTTSGPQGVPQRINPLRNDAQGDPRVLLDPASLTLLDSGGDPADTRVVEGQGTYTIDRSDPDVPVLVFTPLRTYVGPVTPATYRVADVNGTQTRSTYTPALEGVAPKANPDTTTGALNEPQSIDPLDNDAAGDPAVPLDRSSLTLLDANDDPVDSVVVGQGTYTLANGRIVFTPVKGFIGAADPVSYRVADLNGTTDTSTYTPTIEATPVVVDVSTSGTKGSPVTLNPLTDNPAIDPGTIRLVDPDDGSLVTTLVVAGEGTWVVDPSTGEITFTPEVGFDGDPTPVSYQAFEIDGTPVDGTLTISYDESSPSPSPTSSTASSSPSPSLASTGAKAGLIGAGLAGLLLLGGGLTLLVVRRGRGAKVARRE